MKISVPRAVLETMAGAQRAIRVGDLVKTVTEVFGIKPCGGCKKRQKALNRFEIRL